MPSANIGSRATQGTSDVIAASPAANFVSTAALTWFQCKWRHKAEHRLMELIRLPIGWDGHAGRPADRDIVEFAASVLASLMLPRVPVPAIMPLSYGGIQIEWHRNGWDIEIEISAPNQMHIYQHELASGEEREFDIGADLTGLAEVIESIKD
jgi:hypothetical protein